MVKSPLAHAGDSGLIPGPGRSPVKGNANPLHYSCLGNPMDRGAWKATVHGSPLIKATLRKQSLVLGQASGCSEVQSWMYPQFPAPRPGLALLQAHCLPTLPPTFSGALRFSDQAMSSLSRLFLLTSPYNLPTFTLSDPHAVVQ